MTETINRQSPIQQLLADRRPEWMPQTELPLVLRFQDEAAEESQMQRLGLCDFSGLSKLGLKGVEAGDWLRAQGVDVPDSTYETRRLSDGGWIGCLGKNEFLLESSLSNEVVPELNRRLRPESNRLLRVERQDASFLLTGNLALGVLSQTCGVNFAEASPGRLILTRVAGVSCVVLPDFLGETPTYRLWFDCSYAVYLWETLLEICAESGGDAIGAGVIIAATLP
ncbi:hypothetical protein Enr10x_49940 [Gimesia panareensis]|uniref:Sarcosine oxidase, gamma subunit family n=1 Tax=Gimesia panareensis TaxID=2527978 RepID=A0A517QDE8_9PLAN|nr:hypothetical protein [Gimesia panareensis]QDT29639.1 hypothetical protein Enr10x_49940 [Gimesia panareensis]